MRAIMTRAELAEHKAGEHGRNYALSDDGYGDMEVAERSGWSSIAGWGRDGWDLGDWPYVVISERYRNGKYEMRQTVEGDTTVYRFDNAEDAHAAIDYLFLWYGCDSHVGREAGLTYESREALDAGELTVDERFRGPFSWARNEREKTQG